MLAPQHPREALTQQNPTLARRARAPRLCAGRANPLCFTLQVLVLETARQNTAGPTLSSSPLFSVLLRGGEVNPPRGGEPTHPTHEPLCFGRPQTPLRVPRLMHSSGALPERVRCRTPDLFLQKQIALQLLPSCGVCDPLLVPFIC